MCDCQKAEAYNAQRLEKSIRGLPADTMTLLEVEKAVAGLCREEGVNVVRKSSKWNTPADGVKRTTNLELICEHGGASRQKDWQKSKESREL